MQNVNQLCVLCDEAITNPICLDCLENAMIQWAKPYLAEKLKEKTMIFRAFTHRVTDCIVCKSNINVCAHCFCKEIYNWLLKEHPETAESFLTSFNYEIISPCRF